MAATTLADRSLIRLSGDDVRGFLNGLVTNDVTGALPVWAGLLTPQGKVLFDFLIWADGSDLLLDGEAAAAEPLTRRLSLYRLRRAITIVPEPGLGVHWAPGLADADRSGPETGPVGTPVVDPRMPELGHRWLAPPSLPTDAWRHHRLALGVTEGRAELGDGDTLWLECNADALHGVSFTKGCYIGQENTARMHYRGRINRRLLVVPASFATAARIAYPDEGLAIERRRIDDVNDPMLPTWLRRHMAMERSTALPEIGSAKPGG